jgi:DNA-binding beta-propeller fold protein YncE
VIKLRLLLVVLLAVAGCGGGGSTHRKQKRTPAPPNIPAKVTTFKVGGEVWDVGPTPRIVWVAQRGEGRVLRLAPSAHRIGPPTRLSSKSGTLANDLALAGGDVWLAYSGNDGRIARLDAATGALRAPTRVGRGADKLAVAGRAAYVSYLTAITRIPLGGGRAHTVELHRTPNALLFAVGELWATVSDKGSILELNAKTLANENDFDASDAAELTTTADEAQPIGLARGAGSVWAAVVADVGELVRFDLRTRRESARIHLGTPYPSAVAYARGAIWVLDYYANTLTRVDPRTNKVTGRLTVGPPRNRDDIATRLPAALVAQGPNVWVTNADRGTVTLVTLP